MYVSCCNGSICFASRRIRFHAWSARGCTGIRGQRTNRSSPNQPPFYFCTSAFREKESPEEITYSNPYLTELTPGRHAGRGPIQYGTGSSLKG